MPSEVYRPVEAAARLGIAGNTLRVYAARFAPVLSASAARQAGEAGHRQYTVDDLALLMRARQLLEAGATYEQALARLAGPPMAQTSGPEQASQSSEAASGLAAMQEALGAWKALAEDRAREVAALRARMSELEQRVVEMSRPRDSVASHPSLAAQRSALQATETTPGAPSSSKGVATTGVAPPSEAQPANQAPPEPVRHRGASGSDSSQQSRWWNRLFPGDADDGGNDKG
jgi:DNA-binding transcriptional MerR regulator